MRRSPSSIVAPTHRTGVKEALSFTTRAPAKCRTQHLETAQGQTETYIIGAAGKLEIIGRTFTQKSHHAVHCAAIGTGCKSSKMNRIDLNSIVIAAPRKGRNWPCP